jgi:hypothetical protein
MNVIKFNFERLGKGFKAFGGGFYIMFDLSVYGEFLMWQ